MRTPRVRVTRGRKCAEAAEWPRSGALAEGPLHHEWMAGLWRAGDKTGKIQSQGHRSMEAAELISVGPGKSQ